MRMSKVKVIKPKVQGIWKHRLTDTDFVNELQHKYYAFLVSNYGPNNGITLIQNSAGNDFLTASSSTLLEQLNFSHPCFKFINALIKSQVQIHGSNGLYVGILCAGLLWRSWKLEDALSHRVIDEVSQWIHCNLFNNIDQEVSKISIKINVGKLDHMLCIVRGILNSKSFYILTENEVNHIAVKTVEAFLKTIPDSEMKGFGRVVISTYEHSAPTESKIVEGLLYHEIDYTLESVQPILGNLPQENLKIVIFTVPLSHDTEEKQLIQLASNVSLENLVTGHLFQILQKSLKEKGVTVIANQKFIHPALKYDLEKEGFLVMERLGTTNTDALIHMSGCCPISNLYQVQSVIGEEHIGHVSCIKPLIVKNKVFINILPRNPFENVTFLLFGINHHIIEYLMESITSSISLLQRMMEDPSAVCGAGCFEVFIARLLKNLAQGNILSLASSLDAHQSKIKQVFDMYVDMFSHLSIIPSGGKSKKLIDYYVDTCYYHLWEPLDVLQESQDYALHSTSEDDTKFSSCEAKPFCVCRCISKANLPPNAAFVSLLTFKQNDISSNEGIKLPSGVDGIYEGKYHLPKPSPIVLQETSVLDPLPAKLNALRMALEGFSELFRIGWCVFDK